MKKGKQLVWGKGQVSQPPEVVLLPRMVRRHRDRQEVTGVRHEVSALWLCGRICAWLFIESLQSLPYIQYLTEKSACLYVAECGFIRSSSPPGSEKVPQAEEGETVVKHKGSCFRDTLGCQTEVQG